MKEYIEESNLMMYTFTGIFIGVAYTYHEIDHEIDLNSLLHHVYIYRSISWMVYVFIMDGVYI